MGEIQQYPTLGHCLDKINTTGLFAGLEKKKSLKSHLSDFKLSIFADQSLILTPLIPLKFRGVHKLHQAQLKLEDSQLLYLFCVSITSLFNNPKPVSASSRSLTHSTPFNRFFHSLPAFLSSSSTCFHGIKLRTRALNPKTETAESQTQRLEADQQTRVVFNVAAV